MSYFFHHKARKDKIPATLLNLFPSLPVNVCISHFGTFGWDGGLSKLCAYFCNHSVSPLCGLAPSLDNSSWPELQF
jgi:hypothetical protein